jgi:hypothetical protein
VRLVAAFRGDVGKKEAGFGEADHKPRARAVTGPMNQYLKSHPGMGGFGLTTALIAGVLLACQPPSPTTSPTATASPLVVPTTPAASVLPTPTAIAFLDADDLPPAVLEDQGATSICDPKPNRDAGRTPAGCYDATLLGLQALHTATQSVDRIYLRRIPCASTVCTSAELNVVTVTGWSGDMALSVRLDYGRGTTTVPFADQSATWPTPAQAPTSPPVVRLAVAGAPRVVRERAPYPFCGEAPEGPSPVRSCFRDAVLEGLPAEMHDRNAVTGEIWIFRFDGQGLITRYGDSTDGWFRDAGSMILSLAPDLWSFDNWLEAVTIS